MDKKNILHGKKIEDLILSPIRIKRFDDPLSAFKKNATDAGAEVIEGKSIKEILRTYERVLSLYPYENTLHPDNFDDPRELAKFHAAYIRATLGIAENGALLIMEKQPFRAIYTIVEEIIVSVDATSIVHTMHEAYSQIDPENLTYAIFLCGPSKTADIEQTLVLGAHGAQRVKILLQS